jgi:hypothetical protein
VTPGQEDQIYPLESNEDPFFILLYQLSLDLAHFMSENSFGRVLDEIEQDAIRRIHLVGVAGTGMGAFAGMLKAAGYVVSGSDEGVYAPMSDMLRQLGIEVFTPYSADNIERARPDLVIIGNVI